MARTSFHLVLTVLILQKQSRKKAPKPLYSSTLVIFVQDFIIECRYIPTDNTHDQKKCQPGQPKKRTNFTLLQRHELEKSFSQCQYLTPHSCRQLQELGINKQNLKVILFYVQIMNIWKSYMWTVEWRIIWKSIIAVIHTPFAVAKRKSKKIQACTGFEPLTSGIPVQRSSD